MSISDDFFNCYGYSANDPIFNDYIDIIKSIIIDFYQDYKAFIDKFSNELLEDGNMEYIFNPIRYLIGHYKKR